MEERASQARGAENASEPARHTRLLPLGGVVFAQEVAETEEPPAPEETLTWAEGERTRLDTAREEAEAAAAPTEALDAYAARLQELEAAAKRRAEALEELARVREEVQTWEQEEERFEEDGPVEEPPYDLSLLEQLRTDLNVARNKLDMTRLSIKRLEGELTAAEKAVAEASAALAQAAAAAETAEGEEAPPPPAFDLLALAERVAQAKERLAVTELNLARARLELYETQVDVLEDKARAVAKGVVFSEEQLESILADLASRREGVQEELEELRETRQQHDLNVTRTQQAAQADAAPAQSEQLAAAQEWQRTSSLGVDFLEQRLALLDAREQLWQRRYAAYNEDWEAPPADWLAETQAAIARNEENIGVAQQYIEEIRASQGELETLVGDLANGAPPAAVQERLDALAARKNYAEDYMAALVGFERLATRLAQELAPQAQPPLLSMDLRAQWDRQLFIYDERGWEVSHLGKALITFLLTIIVIYLLRSMLRIYAVRTKPNADPTMRHMLQRVAIVLVKKTKFTFVLVLALYFGSLWLPLSEGKRAFIGAVTTVVVAIQIGLYLSVLLERYIENARLRRLKEDPDSAGAFGVFKFLGKVALWSVVFLFILDSLGKDVTTLLATLGIGGIAIAFALQNILGDIFCSLAIVLDKPFAVGDFIIVGEQLGVVENIGIKTTRIRSLWGEQIIIPNADLTGSRVRNYKRMEERRVAFRIGIVYGTPAEKVAAIPQVLREVVEAVEGTRFDRAHFFSYGDFSLVYEIVYYVLTGDYNVYMDKQQEINLGILHQFQELGVEFAFPTQTVHLRQAEGSKPQSQPEWEGM